MKTLYNISAQYVTPLRTVRVTRDGEEIRRYVGPSIAPGGSHEFTEEEAAVLGCEWTEVDPRAGLVEEREFKRRRDAKPDGESLPESTENAPAEPGDAEGVS